MIGDVNIFLNGTPGDQDFEAEAEIMIAGELTLRGTCAPPLLSLSPPFAASDLITIVTFFPRTKLSPEGIR